KTAKYNIFRCLFPGCNKDIPVETFLSHENYSTGISYLQKEGIDLSHDLIAIDVVCPFCCHENHFRIMDKEREISKREYDAHRNAVTSSSSHIRVAYQVKTIAGSVFPTCHPELPLKNEQKSMENPITLMPFEGETLKTLPHFFKFSVQERKEFRR
ncbi:MAG: hypothetical protein RRA35_12885, partial [Desulfomonilia bacterium]|nr:hypothetical protein [Desulfomonilia bacterium]